MKNYLILLITIWSLQSFSQTSDYYISNQGDTVLSKFVTYETPKGKIVPSLFAKGIKVLENGEKRKLKPNTIKSFTITDTQGNTYKFVSLKADNNNFYVEIIEGKISLYNTFGSHPYDGSTSTFQVMVKNDKISHLNVINPKNRIGELISDCPQLYNEWIAKEKYNKKDNEAIVTAYNNCKAD